MAAVLELGQAEGIAHKHVVRIAIRDRTPQTRTPSALRADGVHQVAGRNRSTDTQIFNALEEPASGMHGNSGTWDSLKQH